MAFNKSNQDANQTPTIRVEIYNQTYNIRSNGDGAYISQLAEFVDRRMREISSGTLTVDSLKVAILAALHRLKRLQEQADSQLASRSSECAEMLDRLLKVRTAGGEQGQNLNAGSSSSTIMLS